MTHPAVSVVIPVFGDPSLLEHGLAALAAQTYPRSCVEVLVVDNGSGPALQRIAAAHPRVRFLRETEPGAYAARNAGVRAAGGEIVAFTDADCTPAPDWLERGVAALREGYDVVAGAIEVAPRDAAHPTATELYDTLAYLDQADYVRNDGFGATANLFVWKRVLDAVGPFDAKLLSSGDRDWGLRRAAAGFSLVYAPDVRIAHPALRSWRALVRREARLEGGHRALERNLGVPRKSRIAAVYGRLAPPLRQTRSLAAHPLITGNRRHLQLATATCVARYARTFEALRLALGGAPRR